MPLRIPQLINLAICCALLAPKPALAEVPPADAEPTIKLRFRPGKGLEAKSSDDRFNIITRVRAQFRHSLTKDNADDAGDTKQSLQLRRARVQFGGFMFGKANQYKIELAISPRDLGLRGGALTRTPLLSWYMNFAQLRDLTLRVGQYKLPYSRQRVISSGDLQLVDRSIVNAEFNLDRDIGLDLRSQDFLGLGCMRYYAYIGVGEGRDGFQADDFGMLYITRVELLPFGLFKDYSEADFKRSNKFRLSLGMGYAFLDNAKNNRGIVGSAPADGGTTDTHNFNADAMIKWRGASLHTAVMWREARLRKSGGAVDDDGVVIPTEAPRDGYGWFAQFGYLLGQLPLEAGFRYGLIRPIGDGSSLGDQNELGGAISYYFAQHPLKLQLDYFRLWDDRGLSSGQDELRLQLQAAL